MIAIPLLTLVPGAVGGSETYVRELLRGLGRVGEHDYEVVLPASAADAAGLLPSVTVELPANRLVKLVRTSIEPRFAHMVAGAEVVHYPLTVAVPRSRSARIVTLHDVQHLELPRLFSRAERAYRAIAYDSAARRADRVIVVSEFVKERAVERLGLDPRNVAVTPLGVDLERFRPGDGARDEFLLYPARPWPHKNHATLFSAFELLRRNRPSLRLVLTGGGEYGRVPEGVEVLGHVSRDGVVELLQRAAALVFPSLYEGFGLPPLEAMACGCPVACSDRGSLPEVVGEAAHLFDPESPETIAAAVDEVLGDPLPWIERGLARAQRFSWDETARRTDAVYAELLP